MRPRALRNGAASIPSTGRSLDAIIRRASLALIELSVASMQQSLGLLISVMIGIYGLVCKTVAMGRINYRITNLKTNLF
jgi:hypothetical protein